MKNRLLLLSLMFVCIQVHSQTIPIKALNPLKKDEKISTQAFVKSSNGLLWVGTEKGLFRYNGAGFRLFSVADSLDAAPIKALAQWHKELWIGHKKGEKSAEIEMMSLEGKVRKFRPKEGLPEEDIEKILPLNDSILLIATSGEGLYFYNRNHERLFVITEDDGLNDAFCHDLLPLSPNEVLVSTDAGLAKINFLPANKFEVKTYGRKEGLKDDLTHSLYAENANQVWVSTESLGMVLFDLKQERFTYFDEFAREKIGEIYDAVFFETEAWLATKSKGLVRWKFVEKEIIALPETQSEKVFALLKDENETVWVGTSKRFFQTQGNRFEHFASIPNLSDILLDTAENTLYYSTKDGFFSQDLKTMSVYEYKGINFTITSLYKDKYGYVWGASIESGLCRIDPKTKKILVFNNNISSEAISHVTGKDNLIWVSTFAGVYFAEIQNPNLSAKTNFTPFYSGKETGQYVFKSYFDRKGGIWFCTSDQALSYFKDGKFTYFRDRFDSNTDIHSAIEAQNGILWLATESGTWKFDGKKAQKLPVLEYTNEEAVFSVAEDKFGRVLALRTNSIDLYQADSLLPIHFDKDDGLLGINFGPNIHTIERGKNGQLWLAHSGGIVIYNPSSKLRQTVPRVDIYRTQVFLKEFDPGPKREFAHNQNHLTFDFIALWYVAPEKISYEYMIEGYDISWNFTNKPIATYAGLPPGEYTFKVRATQGASFDHSPISKYKFVIRTPLWQRWWFILIVVLLLVSLIRSIIFVRTKSLLKAKRELETKVMERTAEISAQKEEILVQRDKLQETMEQLAIKSKDLEEAFGLIEKKNKDITGSINYAKRIQSAFLPTLQELKNMLGDYFLIYRPRDIVSGDFYWAYQNAKNEVYLAAVDCTGHGVPGAFMSLIGNSLLNNIVSRYPEAQPDFILNELDRGVRSFLKQEENKTRDGMDAAICKVNRQEGILWISGAQRPIYLIKSHGEFIQIDSDPKPIGGFSERMEFGGYQLFEFQIEAGDKVYLFSDGMPDQFGGSSGKKFMIKHFRALIQKIAQLPLEQQGQILESEIASWQGKNNQTDDWLAIGFSV
jgi:ligand-binding sensor domain-containing protein/serine phosphatase RsbU (regulator of sigma subunit)